MNRQLRAIMVNQLWVSELTDGTAWHSFVYVAFVIGTFDKKIGSWRGSKSMQTQFALDALEKAF